MPPPNTRSGPYAPENTNAAKGRTRSGAGGRSPKNDSADGDGEGHHDDQKLKLAVEHPRTFRRRHSLFSSVSFFNSEIMMWFSVLISALFSIQVKLFGKYFGCYFLTPPYNALFIIHIFIFQLEAWREHRTETSYAVATSRNSGPWQSIKTMWSGSKKALSTLPLDEIQRRLDGSQIVRPWKRRLAETKGARREGMARAALEQARRNAADARRRYADIQLRVWGQVAIAITGTIAAIWATLPR